MSVVVRLPEEIYESARRVAAIQGRQAGELIGEAWTQYLSTHRDKLASDLEAAAQALRNGDSTGLTELGGQNTAERDAQPGRVRE